MVNKIRKRDGSVVPFNKDKIAEAIWKAVKAVGGKDRSRSKELAEILTQQINEKYGEREIPEVEDVQDMVEKLLIEEGHAKVAKAYILYRKSHEELRNVKGLFDTIEAVDDYIGLNDWMIKENSNMGFSLQGLNNYIATKIINNYWVRRVYPEAIRQAHEACDLHIHDLGTLGAYCVGWDLKDLLLTGFTGVPGKVTCKPPKHLGSALGQMVNFFYTLQGETAGAQAFSNFDTLLAPFIRYDNLNYDEVKGNMQSFLFNMAVPTRVGFQCMSEDTEILTPNGWKGHQDLQKGDLIKTFNIKKGIIENKPIKKLFAREYRGVMYNLKNRIQDQLISPGHRVVRKKFSGSYILEKIEDIIRMKSPFIIPIAGKNTSKELEISNEQIKLMAWIIGEGSIERPGKHRCCYRISIYQSAIKKNKNYNEIKKLLNHFKLKYSEYTQKGLGQPVQRLRLNAESSKKVHKWFSKESVGFIPEKLLNMSEKQSKIFIDTYLKAEGFEGCKIATSDFEILNGLQAIASNAGYGSTILTRKPTIGKKLIYILRLIEHKETYIQQVKKINYNGIIWCPNTDNETVIARRNGKVFITGNTPFTNITMDLEVPTYMRDEPVIIGGMPQKETYKEFEKEMAMINRAFAECMLEGDAMGRVFTFPIPTYNITKDFDWDNPEYDLIWEMTAKYGIPYFSNFINSDMKPEDARSMCCRLRLDQTELRKRGGGLFGSNPLTGCYDDKTEILTENGWRLFKELTKKEKVFTLNEKNEIELHKPKKLFEYNYDGKLLHFNRKSLNLMVTPNHKMVVDQIGSGKRKFVEAQNIDVNNQRIPKQGIWKAQDKGEFILPSIEFTKYGRQGRTAYLVNRESLKIKMDLWLKFFGFWLAEGCTDNEKIAKRHGYRTTITQVNKEKKEEIKKVLDELPFSYNEEKNNLVICNKQLWIYLRQFGNKYEKFIPKEIKNLSKRQLKLLFDWMIKGDGHIRKTNGQINYWTASKKLADDLQEIILKLGWLGTLIMQDKKIAYIKGRKVNSNRIYILGVQKSKYYRLRKNNIKEVHYKGKVYCCEVKNHTVMVRREGKVCWCGNSIGVVTINMPRLGFTCLTEDDFLNRLSRLMELAKESLEIKRKAIERFTEKGLYPYSKFYLRLIKERMGEYWKNHFATIGLLGMNESIMNFMPGETIATVKGKEFALKVLKCMREKLEEFQKETGNIYNLEATPGEGTTYRFARYDKKRFGRIIVANERAVREKGTKPYYTNSTQLPVNFTHDLFEALDLQDELQCQYTGGTVLHGFIGEKLSKEGVKKIVKKIAEAYHLPYFTITPTFSICPIHGYLAGEHEYCPKCDQENGYVEQEVEGGEVVMANRAQVIDAIQGKEANDIRLDSPARIE